MKRHSPSSSSLQTLSRLHEGHVSGTLRSGSVKSNLSRGSGVCSGTSELEILREDVGGMRLPGDWVGTFLTACEAPITRGGGSSNVTLRVGLGAAGTEGSAGTGGTAGTAVGGTTDDASSEVDVDVLRNTPVIGSNSSSGGAGGGSSLALALRILFSSDKVLNLLFFPWTPMRLSSGLPSLVDFPFRVLAGLSQLAKTLERFAGFLTGTADGEVLRPEAAGEI
jgi:hypothetical protein